MVPDAFSPQKFLVLPLELKCCYQAVINPQPNNLPLPQANPVIGTGIRLIDAAGYVSAPLPALATPLETTKIVSKPKHC